MFTRTISLLLQSVIAITFFTISSGCDESKIAENKEQMGSISKPPTIQLAQVDTSKAFKFENQWIKPADSVDLSSIQAKGTDTLLIAACSDYINHPFGKIEQKSELSKSLLGKFKVTSKKKKIYDNSKELSEFQVLTFRTNKLLCYFDNDPESSPHSIIVRGSINTNDVKLAKGVHLGMNANDFLKVFFKEGPQNLPYKYFLISPCVGDTNHLYTFENGRLTDIKFIGDGFSKISY